MKFTSGTRRKALEYEKDWVERWKQDKTFERSVEQRPKDNSYVFYDGPPFISGSPHHGTLLSSIVKDVVPRYQTMKGKRVERVWGWDCHGLPAERFTEKKLGINSREEVLGYGLEKYIMACRANMVQTSSEWEDVVDRIGRWVDFQGAYKTMDREYMESVWWAFKELYNKGKIYEGEKVLMYCTLDATPLSKAEVTMDAGAYQDVTDPSVYVKFKLTSESIAELEQRTGLSDSVLRQARMLAWTTTPWTLPANTALAVNNDLAYAVIRSEDETFIVAEKLIGTVFVDEKHKPLTTEILGRVHGTQLVGLTYEPLLGVNRGQNAHKVWAAPYVSYEEGTGIVHLAPAYGEEDFALARQNDIPIIHTIDENGLFTESDWKGQNVWDINKTIAKELHQRGIVWKIEYIRHSYPHCHRCGTKLMYRAHPSWFMDIDGQRQQMLEQNQDINWFPSHVKNGRFAKNIEQAPDWNISRDRFWATAMPVWKGTDKNGTEHVRVVGSYAELKELSGIELKDYHRPWVDDIKFTIDAVEYVRTDKVMDSWFEAGSMPFAQFHYPFENKQKFEDNFPGDFIVEYVGQVRAWFYYMHAMSVALFGENSFKNVIVTGNVAGNDGRKMSKSYGNYTDPNELMDKFSADALRFLLVSSPLLNGEDFVLQDKEVGDVQRKLAMIWNMYDFFTMYAEVDGWEWKGSLDDPSPELHNQLDVWVLSRLHQLQQQMTQDIDTYNLPDALSGVLPFLDDASNWYVRRSRRRFWKSEDDADKNEAYVTLHYLLVRLSIILAPFIPFLAEELYHNLTGGESVHLRDWPALGAIQSDVLDDMARAKGIIEHGLAIRMQKNETESQVKVRQPLATLQYGGIKLNEYYEAIIAEEVNVKTVLYAETEDTVVIDKTITPELHSEGMMREVVRIIQGARKQAGLQVDDRIILRLHTDDGDLNMAIGDHKDTIMAETLALEIADTLSDGYMVESKIEESVLAVELKRADSTDRSL